MLAQISWTLFFVAIVVMIVLYYLYVAIVYYPNELLNLVLGKKNRLPPGTAFRPAGPVPDIMGRIQEEEPHEAYLRKYQPPHEAVGLQPPSSLPLGVDDEEDYFVVASNQDESAVIERAVNHEPDNATSMTNSVSDLMESIKTLFNVIADGEGDRNDVVLFFPSLLAQYPSVAETDHRASINHCIHEYCRSVLQDQLSLEEVNALWSFPYSPQAA